MQTLPSGSLALLIDGEWLGSDGRGTQEVINPATGRPIGLVPLARGGPTGAGRGRAARGRVRGASLPRLADDTPRTARGNHPPRRGTAA